MSDWDYSIEEANAEPEKEEDLSVVIKTRLEAATRDFMKNPCSYSTYLLESSQQTTVTKQTLDDLAVLPQQDRKKIMQINQIATTYANKDWIIGKVYEVISTNINTKYKLSYDATDDNESKLQKAKEIISDFNKKINIGRLIKNSIPNCYLNGNYYVYFRMNEKTGMYDVTTYPLEMVEVSDYDINGEPVLLFNVKELKRKLSRTIKKNRKNKALFYDKIDKEVKENYPSEIYKAYKNNDEFAKLDYRWTGVMRINNQNKKYGLTPIFRALYPTLTLEQFDITDNINSKAKAKKIIAQFLDPDLTKDGRDGYTEQAYAHDNFIKAFKKNTVVVTAPSYVKDIKYIEPSVDTTDTNTVKNYVERVLSTLGISFLMSTNATGATVATISLAQLMKLVNSISEQLEYILQRVYQNVLLENGIDAMYAPTVKVIDSELLEQSVKNDLAKLLYSTFNCSLETALDVLGVDIKDEAMKRKSENENGYDEIFYAHESQFTKTSDGEEVGRPADTDLETQGQRDEDKARRSKKVKKDG